MQIIIPMSGIGKRFLNVGYIEPKPLIIVDNKPMIEHVVNLFPNESNFTFICNQLHLKTTNMKEILNSIKPEGRILSVPNENRQGPVHAVSLVFDQINDSEEVIVSYCDYGTNWNYKLFLEDTHKRNADGAIACYKDFHPHMLGTDNYAFLKETRIGTRWMEKIQEKQPFTNNRMQEYASNGTYYFKSGKIMKHYFQKLIDSNQKINNEFYVSMVYNLMVKDKLKVSIYEINNMLQWGTPYDLENYKYWSEYFKKVMKPIKPIDDKYDITTIIPLAGRGSRFFKNGYQLPKPFLYINKKTMIIAATKCLPNSSNYIFITLTKHITDHNIDEIILQEYSKAKIYSLPFVSKGQACSTEFGIVQSKLNLEKPILISACDNGVYYNQEKYKTLLDNPEIDIIVWTFRNQPTNKNNPEMYAWLQIDKDEYIQNVSCKKFNPKIHNLETSHVIIGTMFFRKAEYFINGLYKNYHQEIQTNNEYYVDDVINQNIKAGLKVKVFEVENYICWGTPDDYNTYIYWQYFFNKCNWHPYNIEQEKFI